MELVQPVILQERKDLIIDWLSKDKLFCTPELGRMVLRLDVDSAVTIFKRSGNKDELAKLYAELCQFGMSPFRFLSKKTFQVFHF